MLERGSNVIESTEISPIMGNEKKAAEEFTKKFTKKSKEIIEIFSEDEA